jgi:hypothetical protein
MKKPKRKKPEPKFRVRQVVYSKDNAEFYKICRIEFSEGRTLYYFHERIWCTRESELRPLTATEIGPRRKRDR